MRSLARDRDGDRPAAREDVGRAAGEVEPRQAEAEVGLGVRNNLRGFGGALRSSLRTQGAARYADGERPNRSDPGLFAVSDGEPGL
jgi:hypothetical protein